MSSRSDCRRTSPALVWGLIFLLCCSGVEFFVRGPLRPQGRGDFVAPYVAGVQFLARHDPYDPATFDKVWNAVGERGGVALDKTQHLIAYPPTTLQAFSFFARLPWHTAVTSYVWLCTLLYLGAVFLLSREIGSSWTNTRRLGFLIFALGLSPVHAGIHLANLSVLSLLCCVYALLLARHERDLPAGLLLTLGIFLKPTVGFTLLLFFLLARRWRILAACSALGAGLAGATFAEMLHIDPAWKLHYQQNVEMMFSGNGSASVASTDPGRFDLLNLQMPLYAVTHSTRTASICAIAITLTLALGWLMAVAHGPRPRMRWNWASISVLSLLSLLPIYQRNYNGGMLLFSIFWAFQNFERRLARAVLVCSSVFLVPGEAWLRNSLNPHLPQAIKDSALWNMAVMPHASWAVLLITCLMLLSLRPASRDATLSAPPDPLDTGDLVTAS